MATERFGWAHNSNLRPPIVLTQPRTEVQKLNHYLYHLPKRIPKGFANSACVIECNFLFFRTLSVSFGVAASSWPGSPSIQFPGQSPSTDVVDELSKAMNITPPASPDSDMSEHEATDSETEANIEWCETMFPLEQSTDGDTDWEER
eukprot:m.53249 g.53249  ORF g.53249 m.53249 type:complete len:147 (-) comp10853_c0_seq1:119-559(-)